LELHIIAVDSIISAMCGFDPVVGSADNVQYR
jgi:hypothetical protein